ncbi:helix-turn-helix domain-containing protein [Wolinella succinogenes]|uniref:helix-turn-helix domain-containing protein n=1 Tax=Wolinella succinogenes TaxID=844 RepID=UPI0016A3051A|nr:helix-turn-helix domain-containing protein [Wolinella succinogenes]NLU34026.1 sigma 54-interacting transcriptional regulator [Wolinella succinogenes]
MSMTMNVAAVAVLMDAGATKFLAHSPSSRELLKSATLLGSLQVNVLIEGEEGVGKTTLAKEILQDFEILDLSRVQKKEHQNLHSKPILLKDFESLQHDETFLSWLKRYDGRIVATSKTPIHSALMDDIFGVVLFVAPLREREEDVEVLKGLFIQQAKDFFGLDENLKVDIKKSRIDLNKNAKSLKKSIFLHLFQQQLSPQEFLNVVENFLLGQLSGEDDYKKLLYLFDAPIIKAAMHKQKSQLKAAKMLGINRNTLRKKIHEVKRYL